MNANAVRDRLIVMRSRKKSEPFERVVLYARQHRASQGVAETLERVTNYLHQSSLEVYQDEDTASSFELALPVLPRHQLRAQSDLIVVVGGDGSLLSAAHLAIQNDVPVIGINRGRLGFLTDISPQELEAQLSAVLQGQYTTEQRFLLQMRLCSDAAGDRCDALNDVVLSRGRETHLVDFDVYVNRQFVSHYRSDGLILATPTGSTAYSLSAGGPIVHPQLNAVLMVPMFSHTLNSRPLVLDGDVLIELHISERNETVLQISCDGREPKHIQPGQRVTVQKNPKRLRLLHPHDYQYYDMLRMKLGWGSKSSC